MRNSIGAGYEASCEYRACHCWVRCWIRPVYKLNIINKRISTSLDTDTVNERNHERYVIIFRLCRHVNTGRMQFMRFAGIQASTVSPGLIVMTTSHVTGKPLTSSTTNGVVKTSPIEPVTVMGRLASGVTVYGGWPPSGTATGTSTVAVASSPGAANAMPRLQANLRAGQFTNNG